MRSILWFLGAVVVLALAFGFYIYLQPAVSDTHTTSVVDGTPATRPAESNIADGSNYHDGRGAWMQEFDENTGYIKSQFRAAKYDRQSDETVKVTNPEAQFFMGAGKVGTRRKIRVVGKTGDVAMTSDKTKAKLTSGGGSQMPSHGLLHDVIIYMYPTENTDEPDMIATMNNAAFDNDTFRIYTEAFTDAGGKKIPADWVPVVVRGKDYDYDGYGLIMYMDELDKQIRQLEIIHGKQLTIKNTAALPGMMAPSAGSSEGPLPWMLATTDNSAAGPILGSKFRTRNSRKPPKVVATTQANNGAYRTTFYDNVHVIQGPDSSVDAETMEVDFLMKQGGDKSASPKSATQKAPAAQASAAKAGIPPSNAAQTNPAQTAVVQPTQSPADIGPSKSSTDRTASATPSAPPAKPATTPATKKSTAPVVVTWTGKMIMVPVDEELESNESIVRFYGKPVLVKQKTSEAKCADLAYDSLDEVVLMHQGNGSPVILTDARGKVVKTPELRYSTPDHVATLTGASSVVSPVADANGVKTGEMTAKWADECDMEFAPAAAGGSDDMVIQRVSMRGDVDVHHPKLAMQAQTLDLTFDPAGPKKKKPTTKTAATKMIARATTGSADDFGGGAALRTVDATGNVVCVIHEPQGQRSIDCAKLHLTTEDAPDGSVVAKTIDAAGDVHAVDTDRDLRAQTMLIWLTDKKPTTREAIPSTKPSNDRELEKLIARKNVVVTRKDGSVVNGDALFVDMKDGQPHVLVTGEKQASVANPTSKLIGKWIELWQGEQRGIVKGAGRMLGTMKQTASSPGKPMDVTWTDNVVLDGAHDKIYVNGGVNIVSTDTNGAQNTAQGKRMVLLLGKIPEKPTTQSTTQASTQSTAQAVARVTTAATQVTKATSQPTTRRSKKAPDDQVDFLSGKDVTDVILLDAVKVDSILGDDKGELIRQVAIRSEELDYDRLNDKTTIPQPGRLLFVDLKPTTRPTTRSTTRSSTKPAATTESSSSGTMASSKGTTSMKWAKSLIYDAKNHLSTMNGDVVVVHKGLKSGEDYNISGDQIVTELADGKTKGDDIGGQVRKVTAQGNVSFTAKGKRIDAASVEYDPVKEILLATGTDRVPAEVFSEAGEPQGKFGQLLYDVKNGKIIKLLDFRGTIRSKEKLQPGETPVQPAQPTAPRGAPLLPKQLPYR